METNSVTNLKIPLAKFIWKKLKILYEKELTEQLKENRRKLQEFYLQFQLTIHLKPNSIISTSSLTNLDNHSQPKDQSNINENQSQVFTFQGYFS